MPTFYLCDDAGEPVPTTDVQLWGEWFQDVANRRVALNVIEGVEVSTVFLGLDHSFRADGPPVLWETLVFGGPLDGEMERYTSRAAAVAGHQAWCRRVREAQRR